MTKAKEITRLMMRRRDRDLRQWLRNGDFGDKPILDALTDMADAGGHEAHWKGIDREVAVRASLRRIDRSKSRGPLSAHGGLLKVLGESFRSSKATSTAKPTCPECGSHQTLEIAWDERVPGMADIFLYCSGTSCHFMSKNMRRRKYLEGGTAMELERSKHQWLQACEEAWDTLAKPEKEKTA